MVALSEGKLSDKTTYMNFEQQAEHDNYWKAELTSICHYFTSLLTNLSTCQHYNPSVISDLGQITGK